MSKEQSGSSCRRKGPVSPKLGGVAVVHTCTSHPTPPQLDGFHCLRQRSDSLEGVARKTPAAALAKRNHPSQLLWERKRIHMHPDGRFLCAKQHGTWPTRLSFPPSDMPADKAINIAKGDGREEMLHFKDSMA